MKLIGLTLEEATKLLTEKLHTWRIVEKNGVKYMMTADVNHNRCNLSIKKGVVTQATFG
jgi:hypothetical protein